MKIPSHSNGNADRLVRIGRRPPANTEALKVLEEAAAWVRAHPEADRLVVLAGSVTTADGLAAHSGDAVHVVGDGPVWLPSASPASLLDVRLHQLD